MGVVERGPEDGRRVLAVGPVVVRGDIVRGIVIGLVLTAALVAAGTWVVRMVLRALGGAS